MVVYQCVDVDYQYCLYYVFGEWFIDVYCVGDDQVVLQFVQQCVFGLVWIVVWQFVVQMMGVEQFVGIGVEVGGDFVGWFVVVYFVGEEVCCVLYVCELVWVQFY